MKLGVELANEYPARQSTVPRIRNLVKQTAMARDCGFDCVLIGQHYLSYPLQTLQPFPLLARLAAGAGDKMKLGTGILLLPLLHPVDVAEQAATLDAITNGRFIFGVALGYEEEEFAAFGLNKKDRVGRFEESLEIIKRLWTEEEVTFHGKHFALEKAVPSAWPVQKPYPPVWIAANNHGAVRRAARLGHVIYASPHAVFSTLEAQMLTYKQALKEYGTRMPEDVAVLKDCYVAETPEAAMREARPALERRYQVYVKQGQDKALPEGDRFDMPFEDLVKDRFIIGDPDYFVDELKRYEALGFNYVVLEFQWPRMEDGLASKCLRILGEKVLPRVK